MLKGEMYQLPLEEEIEKDNENDEVDEFEEKRAVTEEVIEKNTPLEIIDLTVDIDKMEKLAITKLEQAKKEISRIKKLKDVKAEMEKLEKEKKLLQNKSNEFSEVIKERDI